MKDRKIGENMEYIAIYEGGAFMCDSKKNSVGGFFQKKCSEKANGVRFGYLGEGFCIENHGESEAPLLKDTLNAEGTGNFFG